MDILIIVAPLLAGLALIGVCARGIFNNPNVSNSNAIVLGVAALLCIAPTLVNLTAKFPGGTEITLVKDQIKEQTRQIKTDVGEQGANVKGKIETLTKRVEVLEQRASAGGAPAIKPQNTANSDKVVVILYADGQKDLALQMEAYLLQQGYSANSIYTDFTELTEANRQSAGKVAFVSSEAGAALRNEVEKILRAKFPQVQQVVDASSSKMSTTAVQVRLF